MRFSEFSKFTIRPHLFENKQQYKQIVDSVLNSNIAKGIISKSDYVPDGVRKDLKRADRITWWLRWWRKWALQDAVRTKTDRIKASDDLTPEEQNDKILELEKEFEKITKTPFNIGVVNDSLSLKDYFSRITMDHWKSMFEQSPQVNEIEWKADMTPIELHAKLRTAEEEWKEKQEQELEMEPDDQIIIDYGKYAWVKLDREYCELEGRAMGHCGNTATPKEGDRILSFRTKVSGEKQRPHLTFILDKNGYLGEMKGRANEKPSEKYHPYIIDLLQKDFVKGIKGGGYLPESNFSITDLDQEQMNALISKKPSLMTPEEAYTYAVEKVGGRWPEGEEVIAQSPRYALYYAQDFIKERWPEGERAIEQKPNYAYIYARDVIEGRFPEAEDAILQKGISGPIVTYAKDVIGGRWPEAEDIIKQDPGYSYMYANRVINDRWPEAEDIIKTEPDVAYLYAKDVVQGRWPEGEEVIKQDPDSAYMYAKDVIKGRWPEAEDVIKRDEPLWELYKGFVKNNDE